MYENFTPEDWEWFRNTKPEKKRVMKLIKNKVKHLTKVNVEKVNKRIAKEKKRNEFIAKRNARKLLDSYDLRILDYKKRADTKKIEYSLMKDDFIRLVEGNCVYCGDKGVSIDRKDSSKGYTLDNTQSTCVACNIMKYTHSEEKFLNQVKKIHSYRNL